MWNIIVGIMVLGAFSPVLLFIENYVVKNRTANIFIDIFAVIIFTAVCFFSVDGVGSAEQALTLQLFRLYLFFTHYYRIFFAKTI